MKYLNRKIIIKIRKTMQEFLYPTVESLLNQFAIVENATIAQDEYEELLKILDKWKK